MPLRDACRRSIGGIRSTSSVVDGLGVAQGEDLLGNLTALVSADAPWPVL